MDTRILSSRLPANLSLVATDLRQLGNLSSHAFEWVTERESIYDEIATNKTSEVCISHKAFVRPRKLG